MINNILDKVNHAITQATIRKLEKQQAELDKKIKDQQARIQEFSD
ncbi:MAG: hypothetical protein AAFO04_19330 [Cyanobacteria bacterium J06592_8]